MEPRQALQVDQPVAIVWVAFISIVFMLPTAPGGIPGYRRGFSWNADELRAADDRRAFLLFGGWWVALGQASWFKGPVRMGTEEELERLEAAQEGEFLLPADTEFST